MFADIEFQIKDSTVRPDKPQTITETDKEAPDSGVSVSLKFGRTTGIPHLEDLIDEN